MLHMNHPSSSTALLVLETMRCLLFGYVLVGVGGCWWMLVDVGVFQQAGITVGVVFLRVSLLVWCLTSLATTTNAYCLSMRTVYQCALFINAYCLSMRTVYQC
jgi:hypothetical protein